MIKSSLTPPYEELSKALQDLRAYLVVGDRPHGFTKLLAEELSVPYGTAYGLCIGKNIPNNVPDDYWSAVEKAQQKAEKLRIDNVDCKALALHMGIPLQTVRNWKKYGVPAKRRKGAEKALVEMGWWNSSEHHKSL